MSAEQNDSMHIGCVHRYEAAEARVAELESALAWALRLVDSVNDPYDFDRTLGQQLEAFPAAARALLHPAAPEGAQE